MDLSDPTLLEAGGLGALALAILRAYAAPFFSAAKEAATMFRAANKLIEAQTKHIATEEQHHERVDAHQSAVVQLLENIRDRIPFMKVVGGDAEG